MQNKFALYMSALLVATQLTASDDLSTWTGEVKGSMSWETGNTRTTEFASSFSTTRLTVDEAGDNDYEFFAVGRQHYKNKTGNKVSDNDASLKGGFRHYVCPRTAWQVWEKLEFDKPENLAFGSTSVVGLRHGLIIEDETTLHLEGGVGYVYQEGRGTAEDESYPSVAFGFQLMHQLAERLTLTNEFEYIQSVTHTVDFTLDNILALKYQITECWGIELSHEVEFDNTPKRRPSRNAVKTDNTTRASAYYTF